MTATAPFSSSSDLSQSASKALSPKNMPHAALWSGGFTSTSSTPPRQQDEANKIFQRINQRDDLRRQSAERTSYRLTKQ